MRSMFWQTVLSLDIPTGIYACKRVNKFRIGLFMYAINYLGLLAASVIFEPLMFKGMTGMLLYTFGLTSLGVITIIIPVFYVRKWTKEFNQALII